jgi:hypothetical protein
MVYCHISAEHSFDVNLDFLADINAAISRRANLIRPRGYSLTLITFYLRYF